jgi:predicted nucleic acid-binding protein
LPPPLRLAPLAALAVLDANFSAGDREIISLAAADYRRLLDAASERGIAGGQIYDAVIVACAVEGRVDVILTFNARHFAPLRVSGIEIVVPV